MRKPAERPLLAVKRVELQGMVIAGIDRIPAEKSGMEMTAGLIVTTVRLGSMADLAGIATGDILCEVEGRAVTDLPELSNLVNDHDPKEPMRLLFRRVGAWRFLAFPPQFCAETG